MEALCALEMDLACSSASSLPASGSQAVLQAVRPCSDLLAAIFVAGLLSRVIERCHSPDGAGWRHTTFGTDPTQSLLFAVPFSD